jgi:DNA-binding NarL/FixJ family response regulator
MQDRRTIIIADDHPLMTEGLTALIHSSTPYSVIKTVHNGKALMQILNRTLPDLVLLDINMPLLGGIEASAQIKQRFPTVKVAVISMFFENQLIRNLKQTGVDGFIPKLSEGSAFINALRNIMDGKKLFISIKDIDEADKTQSAWPALNELSEREIEIVRQIKQGLSSKQISKHLNISVYTVDTHRKNICRKLHITSPNALIKFAMKYDI